MKSRSLIFTFLISMLGSELFAHEILPYKTTKFSTIDTFGLPEKKVLPTKELNVLVWNIQKTSHPQFHID